MESTNKAYKIRNIFAIFTRLYNMQFLQDYMIFYLVQPPG